MHKILIKYPITQQEFERFGLFKELERQKIPVYGSNNLKILLEMSVNKPLINKIFEKNTPQDNLYKNLERYSLSKEIRNNSKI